MKNKPLLWGGAGLVAAILIVYFAFFSNSPSDTDLQGAIGAAKVQRTDQIASADVVLQDPEIQDLLQSEFFYKLATDDAFRKVAVDQLARLDLASGRSLEFTNVASLNDMKSFLDLTQRNADLAQAMADGRLNVVRQFLDANGKSELLDVSNRVYSMLGRHPQLNLAAMRDMKMFLESALGNAQLRNAFIDGRLETVDAMLASDRHPELADAARKVFVAEARRPQLDCAGLADLRVFLDLASTNADLKAAMADGRMNRVNEILEASNRMELIDAANRIAMTQGRNAQLNAAALADMKMALGVALENRDLKLAMADGRMERVNEILVKDGRAALSDAAGKICLADRRQPQFTEAGLADLKLFLDFAMTNADLKAALADGKMNLVNATLLENGKAEMIGAANRIYSMQGSIQINDPALADMKNFLGVAMNNPDLKLAMVEGRIADVDAALVKDNRAAMCLASNRVYVIENRRPQLASDLGLVNQRAIASFAAENAEFRAAMEAGKLDKAAQLALAAGKHDIALRNLQMASFVLGDSRNFVPDLNRMLTVADSPSFKMAAGNEGWGRLVASVDAASWRQTVDAVKDGKMAAQQQ